MHVRMSGRARARGLSFFLVVAVVGSVAQLPALSVTKSEVDQACAASKEQYAVYKAAEDKFIEANLAWEATQNDIAAIEYKRERAVERVEFRQSEIDDIEVRIQALAVALYMQGGSGSDLVLFADSMDEIITGTEFLSAATEDEMGSLDDLLASKSELERLQDELVAIDAQLRELEVEQKSYADESQAIAEEKQAAFAQLSAECQSLNRKYQAQLAAEAARQAAARGGRAAGIASISGFSCPFPGSSFIDSWGFPRSGGRSHRGVDMFGPWNAPLVASADGYVLVANGGLGGKTVWLISDNGFAYYYAHLSSWNVSSGQRVTGGVTVIGYNGDTGNARGGSPHLHFEIHPGGRGAPAVNPYPTVRGAC